MDISVLSSSVKTVINVNGKNIIDTDKKSVNTVLINNNNILINQLPENIHLFDTFIVATCGSNNNLHFLKKYGGTQICGINNYVFIKQNNKIIYEKASKFPIMYPLVYYSNITCKNGINRETPKYNIFNKTSNTNEQIRHMCAIESYSLGYNSFAVRDGICFPLKEYPTNYPDSPTCLDGSGNTFSSSVYNFSVLQEPVIINETMKTMEGEYTGVFKHIKLPNNFIAYLILNNQLQETIKGPIEKNLDNINKIIIKNINGGVLFGESDTKYIILDRGSHMLPPGLWLNIKYIKFIDQEKIYHVELYANINFSDFVANSHNENIYDIFGLFKIRITTNNNTINIEYPKIIRSIIIK